MPFRNQPSDRGIEPASKVGLSLSSLALVVFAVLLLVLAVVMISTLI